MHPRVGLLHDVALGTPKPKPSARQRRRFWTLNSRGAKPQSLARGASCVLWDCFKKLRALGLLQKALCLLLKKRKTTLAVTATVSASTAGISLLLDDPLAKQAQQLLLLLLLRLWLRLQHTTAVHTAHAAACCCAGCGSAPLLLCLQLRPRLCQLAPLLVACRVGGRGRCTDSQ